MTIYTGRFLVSRNILEMYFPIIPKASNWTPPINKMIQTKLAQPETLPPIVSLRIMINRIPRIEAKNETDPAHSERFNGASEKLIKPSIEYLNKLQKLHDVSPATRSRFS